MARASALAAEANSEPPPGLVLHAVGSAAPVPIAAGSTTGEPTARVASPASRGCSAGAAAVSTGSATNAGGVPAVPSANTTTFSTMDCSASAVGHALAERSPICGCRLRGGGCPRASAIDKHLSKRVWTLEVRVGIPGTLILQYEWALISSDTSPSIPTGTAWSRWRLLRRMRPTGVTCAEI